MAVELSIHDPDVRAVADLLAQRHGPGPGGWQRLEDVVPSALALLLLTDAAAVVELLRRRWA